MDTPHLASQPAATAQPSPHAPPPRDDLAVVSQERREARDEEMALQQSGGFAAISITPPDDSKGLQPRVIHLPFTRIPMPGFLANIFFGIGDFGQRQRNYVLNNAPDFVINYSSNLIGATQLVGEMLAFKSNGSDLVNPENRGKPLHYLIDPPRNIYNALSAKASFELQPKDLLRPSFYVDTFNSYRDLEKASAFDRALSPKLINRWQARSGFCGIMSMAVTTLLPNAKDDPDETQRLSDMFHDHPFQYVGTRLGHALWMPGWGEHKTQFAGLGMTATGVCSFLSGFRNVSAKAGMPDKYFFNRAHAIGGLITAAAGAQLWLGVDSQQSWQNYGTTQFLRLAFLPKSIINRYKHSERGRHYYLGASTVFQSKNVVAYLIGGAERDADGNVVDKVALRREMLSQRKKGQGLVDEAFDKIEPEDKLKSQAHLMEAAASEEPESTKIEPPEATKNTSKAQAHQPIETPRSAVSTPVTDHNRAHAPEHETAIARRA